MKSWNLIGIQDIMYKFKPAKEKLMKNQIVAFSDDCNDRLFHVIPGSIFRRKDLSPSAKLLCTHIISLTEEDGYCYETNNFFANYHNKSKTSIKSYLKELRDKEIISVIIGYNGDGTIVRRIRILLNLI
jgi:hypothetical protein